MHIVDIYLICIALAPSAIFVLYQRARLSDQQLLINGIVARILQEALWLCLLINMRSESNLIDLSTNVLSEIVY